jgi:hypothetical protein
MLRTGHADTWTASLGLDPPTHLDPKQYVWAVVRLHDDAGYALVVLGRVGEAIALPAEPGYEEITYRSDQG